MLSPLISLESQKSERIKFDTNESFDVTTNNAQFKLNISYNENLIYFGVEKIGQLPKEDYNTSFNMNQLGDINKFLLQFDSFSELFEAIKEIIKSNKLSIIEENKNIKIQITNPLNKKTFNFIVPLKEKDLKSEISSLTDYVISLNNIVTNLENQLKERTERIKCLEEQMKEIMSIKNEYETLKKEEIKKDNRFFLKSNIIKIEDESIILSWFDRKPVTFVKLFDSKIHGDNIDTFYNICSKKVPIIIFIKTTNGYRFGGFTCKLLPTSGKFSKDNKAFVFSLDRKEKYKINTPQYCTQYLNGSYFEFGGPNIVIQQNCTTNQTNFVSSSHYDVPSNYAINGGESEFVVSSYEAYQLEY